MNPSEPLDSDLPDDSRGASPADAEDAMLDALLSEVIGGQSPPDQSRVILQRLDTSGARTSQKKSLRTQKNTSSNWRFALASASIVLFAIGTIIGLRYRNQINIAQTPTSSAPTETFANSDLDSNSAAQSQPTFAPETAGEDDGTGGTLPSRTIELADGSTDPDAFRPDSIGLFDNAPLNGSDQTDASKPTPQALTLVSTVMTDRLERYWDRVGVQPTDMMPADAVSKRLHDKFGIRVPEHAIGNSERMLAALSETRNTDALASQVLAAIASRPAESLTSSSDRLMGKQISQTLSSGHGFDRLIASWFVERKTSSGKSETAKDTNAAATASFHELLRPLGEHETLVTTAAVALNADLRCQRCHDLPQVGGDRNQAISQHDYWQLAATISPWLPIRPNAPAGRFYDLPDGRRRLAPADPDADWPERLLGSRSLAEGLVGAMWKMVHGRPLASSPYDLSGGAADSDLQRLRNELADDLLASDFNLLRTISLMMSDSIVARSTPSAMTPAGVLTASDTDWIRAVAAIESFAASPPESMPTSRGHRMRLVQDSSLPRLGAGGASGAVLAQPLGSDDSPGADKANSRNRKSAAPSKPSPAILAGLPMRPTVVMPAWISELSDFDSRLQHVSYLAGLDGTPEPAAKLATQMRDARVEEALILQRIWWIIRPQG
ncbi:hypothetical protein [Aporhodopirellula aestuarii]|uniref:DUF1549 domain-containing protein n=1 Tax=Aporhodopirellula aestuarii TaxID=2950107 RepID=A0ABT0U2W4_9BACT|nr:hypothetical protein [Aporhodopirellula aestuarii]MCM2371236.1 hypothetical protein [Aporhodopirellula aestuarii]